MCLSSRLCPGYRSWEQHTPISTSLIHIPRGYRPPYVHVPVTKSIVITRRSLPLIPAPPPSHRPRLLFTNHTFLPVAGLSSPPSYSDLLPVFVRSQPHPSWPSLLRQCAHMLPAHHAAHGRARPARSPPPFESSPETQRTPGPEAKAALSSRSTCS